MTISFHTNTREEIKELEAKIMNLDTDMQTLGDGHNT